MKLGNVESIVTFHLSQVGDLLFSLPAVAALRERWPEAHVTAVVRPNLTDLLRDSPLVDETLCPKKVSVSGLCSLAKQIRLRDPDLAVCFSQAPFLRLATRLCGAPVRAGLSGAWLDSVLTHSVPKVGPPSTANNIRLVESLGCAVRQRTYGGLVTPSPEACARIDERLVEAGICCERQLLAFGPAASARRTHREWPRERFVELSARVTGAHDATVIFVGVSPFLTAEDRVPPTVLDWSGTTTLMEAAALLRRARLFVGLDSGLMHLAAAMGTPVVGLFGPTDPATTGPLCDQYEIVRAADPGQPGCMEQVQVDAVARAVAELLSRTEPP